MRFRHLPCRRSQPAAYWWRYVAQALLTLLLISFAGTLLCSQPAYAADITVDGTNCTLVEAITAANNDNAAGNGCVSGSGADTITLLNDVSLSAVDNDTNGPNGLPVISSAITIAGGSHTISRTSAAPAFRFFYVATNGTFTLNQLTLTGGNTTYGGAIYTRGTVTLNNSTLAANTSSFGGAIYAYGTLLVNNSMLSANVAATNAGAIENYGTVTVNNSTLIGNSAAMGGAIRNFATMTLNNSTISANAATNNGGAILNDSTLTINNSTLSTNTAAAGGAIYNFNSITVNNSTLSANAATSSGGAIFNQGTVTVSNSTLSGNSAPTGGAIRDNGTITMSNSTLSGNTGNTGGAIYTRGTVTLVRSLITGNNATSSGPEIYKTNEGIVNANNFNLIGYGGSARSVNFTPGASDLVPGVALAAILNPTLADNGGGTLTHALVAGSPALNAAGDSGLATDQRGITRPQGAADDIGAFEWVAPPPIITIVLDAVPDLSTNLAFGGTLGAFILDDPTVDDGDAYTNTKSFTVTPGVYTVRRNNPVGWFTTAITCSPSGNATVNLPLRSAAITVANGDNVTCTYAVERAAILNARAFHDLVRNNTNLGRRNAGDPWLDGWTMTLYTAPTATVGSKVTSVSGSVSQASFTNLRAGSYTVCTTPPTAGWTFTTPTAPDPAYGQPCKSVTLTAGQTATLLFGAYQATVTASESGRAGDESITDDDSITDRPYDPAEDESAVIDEEYVGARRLFLPLVQR